MKILIVFNHPAPYKVKLFNELAKAIDVDVIFEIKKAKDRTIEFYGEQNYKFKQIVLPLIPIGDENAFGFSIARFIKKHHHEYDHIILNGYSTFAEMSAIRTLNRLHIPFDLMINGGVIHKEKKIKKNIKTSFISSANRYLCPNKESIDYLLYYGAKKENILLYPYSNIFKKDIKSSPSSEELKKQICIKYHLPYGPIFINPSQFIPRKNNEELLEIFKDRSENLVLIGDGPLRKKYEKYVTDNKIKNVHILHFLNQNSLKEIMSVSTALITLSKEDIFGHTVLEALSCGCPVISSDKVMSALDVIKNGVNGFVVNNDNYSEINEAINNVVDIKFEDVITSVENHTIDESAKIILELLNK